jgi:hypothetical protein
MRASQREARYEAPTVDRDDATGAAGASVKPFAVSRWGP